jgi:hypothetical protein
METMRGDLVRGLLDGAAAFVYDLSGISAVDGVTAVTDRINYFSEQIVDNPYAFLWL